jgi:hypothetical protein
MPDELAEVFRYHDEEPERAAAALRRIAAEAIEGSDVQRFTFLANHVIGEKQGGWREAAALVNSVVGAHGEPPRPALRNAAVASLFAGDLVRSLAWQRALASATGADPAAVRLAILAGALSYIEEKSDETCRAFTELAAEIDRMPANPVDDLIAGAVNNFTSSLLDIDDTKLSAAAREALERGALTARSTWKRAGTWVNHERAEYLCALAFWKLARYAEARDSAARGLEIIGAHESEEVDRAFLFLALAAATLRCGDAAAGNAAYAKARKIAGGWNDAGLVDWFAGEERKYGLAPAPAA